MLGSNKPAKRQDGSKDPQQTIKVLLWNIEGIKNASSMLPNDFFMEYDLTLLTATMLTSEWTSSNLYKIHQLATQERIRKGA